MKAQEWTEWWGQPERVALHQRMEDVIADLAGAEARAESAERRVAGLRKAILSRAKARKAVTDWMEAEGKQGHFRTNSQAPGWFAYQEAEWELSKQIAAVEADAALAAEEGKK